MYADIAIDVVADRGGDRVRKCQVYIYIYIHHIHNTCAQKRCSFDLDNDSDIDQGG